MVTSLSGFSEPQVLHLFSKAITLKPASLLSCLLPFIRFRIYGRSLTGANSIPVAPETQCSRLQPGQDHGQRQVIPSSAGCQSLTSALSLEQWSANSGLPLRD